MHRETDIWKCENIEPSFKPIMIAAVIAVSIAAVSYTDRCCRNGGYRCKTAGAQADDCSRFTCCAPLIARERCAWCILAEDEKERERSLERIFILSDTTSLYINRSDSRK